MTLFTTAHYTNPMANVAIAGVSGYSGQVLKELLNKHPFLKLTHLIGREEPLKNIEGCQIAFLCTPAETSLELAPQLLKKNVHVVDVSGAFRLKQHSYAEWYQLEHHHPDLLPTAIYGLAPFANNKVLEAGKKNTPVLIANPGCYATAALLALIPLLKSGLVNQETIKIDAKSGTSGAGKKANQDLLFTEIFGNFYPYRLGKHQHWPEIVEAVENFAGHKISFNFVTELLPIDRGISLCLFADWKEKNPTNTQNLLKAYKSAFEGCPEIRIGTGTENLDLLALKKVHGSPGAHIYVTESYGSPLVFVSIDNLMRGAASQALMNANLIFGRPTLEGLL